MTTQYLPLTEYSSKYKVSISTLRRRIKAEDISYVFEDGKYLIQDGPVSTHQRVHRPSPRYSEETTLMSAQQHQPASAQQHPAASAPLQASTPTWDSRSTAFGSSTGSIISEAAPMFGRMDISNTDNESALTVANRLLTELKKAYSQILHEKEEQILHLKEELADLKTLARVLESENDRLSRYQK